MKVEFHGKPVSRLNVVLNPKESTTAKGQKDAIVRRTGSDGIAKFTAVPLGEYSFGVQGLLGPGYNEVTVARAEKNPDHIVIEWPNIHYTVHHVSGRLVSPDQQLPLQNVGIEVLVPRTARKVAETRTDADGRYDIPVLDDGAYVLRLIPPGNAGNHEDLGVEVNSGSLKTQMPLLILQDSECGTSLSSAE